MAEQTMEQRRAALHKPVDGEQFAPHFTALGGPAAAPVPIRLAAKPVSPAKQGGSSSHDFYNGGSGV